MYSSGLPSFIGPSAPATFTAQVSGLFASACLILLGACGGHSYEADKPASLPAVQAELTLEQALEQLDALAAAPATNAADFDALKSALEQQLLHSGRTRWSSAAPQDTANAVDDLELAKLDDFSAAASWTYRNVGDYDQNRQVNISDLTPLGAGLGTGSGDPEWSTARVADGDGNDEVNISDITPLGAHLQNSVDGYFIEASMTPEDEESWLPAGLALFDDSTLPEAGGPRRFSATVPAVVGQHFRVVPFSGLERGIAGPALEYTGQTGGGPELSYEERETVFNAVIEKLDNLTAATSAGQDAELAEFLAGFPQIEESGFYEGNAWARFTDGRPLIVCKNRAPGEQTAASSLMPEPALLPLRIPSEMGLPGNEFADLYNSFGPGNIYVGVSSEISSLLNAYGYTATPWTSTVENLRSTTEPGVFYIDGHGGSARLLDGTKQYGISTGEATSEARDLEYIDDLLEHRLGYAVARNGHGVSVTNYYFTDAFVLEYMSFADNSLVFLNCCNSGTAQDMLFALHLKGASTCLGWTFSVPDPIAGKAAKHFFDRLLGANQYSLTESPPVRPFQYQTILTDMGQRGVSAGSPIAFPAVPPEPAIYQSLIFSIDIGDPEVGFYILSPTISHCNVQDAIGRLQLFGDFGEKQGKVTVGGTELNITTWLSPLIECDLPATGAGSAGDVVVEVDGHQSNVRRISEWRGTAAYVVDDAGSLTRNITFNLHFRADIGGWRSLPADDPLPGPSRDGLIGLHGASDSYGTASHSGEHITEPIKVTWSDAEVTNLPLAAESSSLEHRISCAGSFDLNARTMYLYLAAFGGYREKIEDIETEEVLKDDDEDFGEDLFKFSGLPSGVLLQLMADGSIEGKQFIALIDDISYTLDVGQMSITSPPDPQAKQ